MAKTLERSNPTASPPKTLYENITPGEILETGAMKEGVYIF